MFEFEELEDMEREGEVELILDYNDFKVVQFGEEYYYMDIAEREVREVELIGEVDISIDDFDEDSLISGKLEKYGFEDFYSDVNGEAFHEQKFMYFVFI